jgi:anaerobic magnesium-protoporphyrin IX monomethyl ester cyclase
MSTLDVIFVSYVDSENVYQELSKNISAIEPPTWSLLLAQSCRAQGFNVSILDASAENLSIEEATSRVIANNPKLVCFVVYGQNVNSGTVNMSGSIKLANSIKAANSALPVAFVGSYVQALPKKALQDEPCIDFVFMNEGVYALWNVLKNDINVHDMSGIKGIAWRKNGEVIFNDPEQVVPTERMDQDLPGYAWDLLPYKERPLDLYRAPYWHAQYADEKRSPYAALQTSLGCQFGCSFCMINILNRNDNEEIGVASNYSKMRFWSPEFIFQEFKKLHEMGVTTIKITDEMFLLNKRYYEPLCKMLHESGIGKDLTMWAYSRVDTVRNPEILDLVRKAGIKWLALGIESSSKKVRLEVTKGKFEDVDIEKVVQQVEEAGIDVMGNYIFGLPGDTIETMQQTLDFSMSLNTAGWNAYPAVALPGSQLYKDSLNNSFELPNSYDQFGFHSKRTLPMYNPNLTRKEILKFRDEAYIKYHSSENFLNKIEQKFGLSARQNILNSLEIRIERDELS